MDYDAYQSIRFRPERGLWAGDGRRFEVRYFHLGLHSRDPVGLHELVDGRAHEITYDPGMFDHYRSGLDGVPLPADLGFAGFRLLFHTDRDRDIAAFLGASYFRAVGKEMQFGLSARGLAIDTGLSRAEEFPRFTAFWFEQPAPTARSLVIHALLDSPSITGAYRFDIAPGDTLTMEVDVALYPRRRIERLGIAPLTSMYQTGENDRRMANDWRPEIHDSDGLALLTGNGEWLWRPLANPAELRFNAYLDENPRGFGLLQRDRDFDNYQDDGVFYDRRPDLWVEPRGNWGKGAVQLVELPTPDETNDNIVAFWNPAAPVEAGQELLYGYRLHWGSRTPARPPLAHVIATRTGLGGMVGVPRTYFSRRFAVDFAGGELSRLGPGTEVVPVIDSSRGAVEFPTARPLEPVSGYRAVFDLRPDTGREPINLRLHLEADGRRLTETWLYQWSPPAASSR